MIEEQRQYNGETIVFSTNDDITTGHPHAKEKKKKESWHRLDILHKNYFKMDHRHKCKMQDCKDFRITQEKT